ncbi:exonuclease SbcCD subunit D [Defluviitalea raffinosedens]|jgi:exonuclease SbcD|uniref:Nuclease SbcCD subunit D n=1 Tax=Defluviitalea raffinosedens TaxID=1450156 RepID=A0A7C8LED7_9FIRM|nr:exonuclease SbcCD subunit D [Defluviitalea raffinosedens]KAE9633997.1 exonuclease subunit SbcD [Defluviitalea raffinosedens]MBM7685874.1 exonuclease SbcD [Defluviitalea raffinosedens]MBZ4668355.1 putative repair exonuclease [Defluviitaleaceae bacterium]HHW67938.1 exonuclease SbcCD subunit D [Candidatus Epulonipiscium sp.]
MRILHTSDWHLGKNLENYSRLDEQAEFIEELIEIIDNKQVDMVIISGDVYDTGNPPAKAEKLFYSAMQRIANGGKRPVLVIAGNHDNPERLSAPSPLAYEQGIILLGTPKSVAQVGDYPHYRIVDAGEGYVEIELKGEKVVAITLPYPSEKRLNEIISFDMDEEEMQSSYSKRIGKLFESLSSKYRDDTINIAVSHLFMIGGEETDSERPIQLGGSLAVDPSVLPKKAQYVALGHLHRPQKVKGTEVEAYYSGSPIQYSKSEISYSKCLYIVDISAGEKAKIEEVYLKNYKPIEVWRCENIEEAMEKCRENSQRNLWVYLEVKTDRVLLQSEIKELKRLKQDIVEILPVYTNQENEEEIENIKDKSIDTLFKEFYIQHRQVEPTEEMMELFLSVMMGEEDEDAAEEA